MKRGNTWSYVIRVKDPETGVSKPVGGRLRHRGRRQGRSRRGAGQGSARRVHRPQRDHRWRVPRRVAREPRHGDQAGDVGGLPEGHPALRQPVHRRPEAPGRTAVHDHQALPRPTEGRRPERKAARRVDRGAYARDPSPAFRDAVIVDQLIDNSPVERAKRPRVRYGTRHGLDARPTPNVPGPRASHRLFAFFHVAAYTGARRGELLNLRWPDVDFDGKQITITGSAGVVEGERLEGTTKSGRTRVVSIDDETVTVLRGTTRPSRRTSSRPATRGTARRTATSSQRAGVSRFTPTR